MQPLGSQEGLGVKLPSQLTSAFSATLHRQWEMAASRALPILVTSASPVPKVHMAQGLLLVQAANKLRRTKRPGNILPPFWVLAICVVNTEVALTVQGRGMV